MKEPKKKYTKISLEFILHFYDACVRNEEMTAIAHMLDIHREVLKARIKKFPALQLAKRMAEEKRNSQKSFSGYVFQHLSPEAKEIWDSIRFWESSEMKNDKISALLEGKPTRLRQELWVHAFVNSSWSQSEACRIAGVTRDVLEQWKHNEEFKLLLEELHWHKKNWAETQLNKCVDAGNASAVMFMNRTLNADRGYNEKLLVEHSGRVSGGAGVDIDSLDLPIEVRRAILDAVRKKKEEAAFLASRPILQLSQDNSLENVA